MHQHHVRRLDGHVGTGADGKPHVRRYQCRGVVDAVAHHGHELAALLQLLDTAGLILRQHLRDDPLHADLTGDGLGGAPVVAGEQHHLTPAAAQGGNGGGAVGLYHIRHGDDAQQLLLLGEVQGRFACGGQRLRRGAEGGCSRADQGHVAVISGVEGLAVQHGLHPAAGYGGEIGHVAQGDAPPRRLLYDGICQRVTGGLFQRGGGAQQLLLGDAGDAQHIRDLRRACGDGAGLVQHHGVHPSQQLQTGGGLDENAPFGGLAGGDGDGHRCGKSQRAGAGDHQHGDADGQAEPDAHAAHRRPQHGGEDGNGDHHRHEHGADLICQTADGGLGGGGLLHELDDLGQGGIRAHPVGGQLQIAAGENGGGYGAAAGGLLHRHTLAGEGGFVHSAAALGDGTVHGDAPTLPDDDGLTGSDLVGGHRDLRPVPAHHRRLRRQRQQRRDRAGGLALGALLQILAHGDEGQDHAGGLKIEVGHTSELSGAQQTHFDETVRKARRRAQRHQRVHVGAALE